MIRFFQGYENAIEGPSGKEPSCKKTWDETTPHNLREAIGLIWHATDHSPTWIEVNGITFEGELFIAPDTDDDSKAFYKIVHLLMQLATANPQQNRGTNLTFGPPPPGL